MENEGGNIKVGVGESSSGVSHQDQFIDNVWWSAVMPHNAYAKIGGFEPHYSGTQAGSIAEPHMSGISANDIGQVSGLICRLHSEGLLIQNLLVKGQQN